MRKVFQGEVQGGSHHTDGQHFSIFFCTFLLVKDACLRAACLSTFPHFHREKRGVYREAGGEAVGT